MTHPATRCCGLPVFTFDHEGRKSRTNEDEAREKQWPLLTVEQLVQACSTLHQPPRECTRLPWLMAPPGLGCGTRPSLSRRRWYWRRSRCKDLKNVSPIGPRSTLHVSQFPILRPVERPCSSPPGLGNRMRHESALRDSTATSHVACNGRIGKELQRACSSVSIHQLG